MKRIVRATRRRLGVESLEARSLLSVSAADEIFVRFNATDPPAQRAAELGSVGASIVTSYPDGPDTTNLFNEFTDFAAKMGWEYTLFDAGWWEPGLKPIANYAAAKNVMPLAWLFATDFYYPKRSAKKLDEMVAAGIRRHKGHVIGCLD